MSALPSQVAQSETTTQPSQSETSQPFQPVVFNLLFFPAKSLAQTMLLDDSVAVYKGHFQ